MKRKTIRKHGDFLTRPDDLLIHCKWFMVKVRRAVENVPGRYGLIASKRFFPTAVERNRAKRLLRDWIAFNEHKMAPDLDYIFIARNEVLDMCRKKGRKAVARVIKRVSKTIQQ